jgi:hypothetical protein
VVAKARVERQLGLIDFVHPDASQGLLRATGARRDHGPDARLRPRLRRPTDDERQGERECYGEGEGSVHGTIG